MTKSMESSGLVGKDGAKIPLEGVAVTGELCGGFAQVKVTQRYRNAEGKPVEAVYTFPLPADATLTGFAMVAGGRRLDGVVKEREDAFKQYDDAITAGHGAALLEQERPNVITASVGNLLPGEETLVEVSYVQRLAADEGSLRWMIPTLVAPRYIPGAPAGDRTAGGHADPTDRVPDADRITPPIGKVDYGLRLDLLVNVGPDIVVESPSHGISTQREGQKTRVSFQQKEVALDRDVVLSVTNAKDGPLAGAFLHRPQGEEAFLALSIIPDLTLHARAARQDVVFVIDVSGSMGGTSLPEAQAALRLCLRHLREGDRFNVIAFESAFETFRPELVGFTQKTLEEADVWVQALYPKGGTEMLQPLLQAARIAPGGVVVLLTDGQVGNEDEIGRQVLAAAAGARFYSFGIGSNVSDALLRTLGRETGGAVEFIHPGERIDDKVVAQFSRAIAPRVTDVAVTFEGLSVAELAPGRPAALVDGEPWNLIGKLEGPGRSGHAEIRGKLGKDPFFLSVAIDALGDDEHPLLPYLWAAERIRDFEGAALSGRRAERMKERITEMAVRYKIASRYTSFLVVETRTGDRRASGQPETRVIPVSTPAGWSMFDKREVPMFGAATRTGGLPFPSAPPPIAAAPMKAIVAQAGHMPGMAGGGAMGGPPSSPPPAPMQLSAPRGRRVSLDAMEDLPAEEKAKRAESGDPIVTLLARQLASGLWPGADDPARARATADALLELHANGVTTTSAKYGAQVKKAIEALLAVLGSLDGRTAERALCAAWLAAESPRTRREVETRVKAHAAALGPFQGDVSQLKERAAKLA